MTSCQIKIHVPFSNRHRLGAFEPALSTCGVITWLSVIMH